MSYFIFQKKSDNILGTLYKIAENIDDLNNLNIIKSDYKIIEDSQNNFLDVKFGLKYPSSYNESSIINYQVTYIYFQNKEFLNNYINNNKNAIMQFLNFNTNHSLFEKWKNYYNQLNNLNLDSITYPLNKSLEQYFNDLQQPSLNPLQLP
jgi:hypothetical protein